MIERAEHLACTYTITYNCIGYAFLFSLLSARFTSWYIQKIIVPKCILYELQKMDDLIEKSKILWAKLREIPAKLKRRSSQ